MAMIVYGWGDVIKNKQCMGYRYCDGCGNFQLYYLAKKVFRIHISYIPIFMKTKGYYICCNTCKTGWEISKQEFRQLKNDFKPMKKSMAKKCYKEICDLCDTMDACNEANVDYIMVQLAAKYPIADNQALKDHYHKLIATKLSIIEQIKHPGAQLTTGTAAALPQSNATMDQLNVWTCSCGAVNTNKFCADCGAQQPKPTSDPMASAGGSSTKPAAVTVCPRCGKEDPKAPFFCSGCGSPMNPNN